MTEGIHVQSEQSLLQRQEVAGEQGLHLRDAVQEALGGEEHVEVDGDDPRHAAAALPLLLPGQGERLINTLILYTQTSHSQLHTHTIMHTV